jgi:hypothetical protein
MRLVFFDAGRSPAKRIGDVFRLYEAVIVRRVLRRS